MTLLFNTQTLNLSSIKVGREELEGGRGIGKLGRKEKGERGKGREEGRLGERRG